MFTAETWPIGGNMLSFGSHTSDGTPTLEASSAVWAAQLREMRELGVDQIDPTDAWLPLAKLSDQRLEEFRRVLDGEGMSLSSISMTRHSVWTVSMGKRTSTLPCGSSDSRRRAAGRWGTTGSCRILPRRSRRRCGSGSATVMWTIQRYASSQSNAYSNSVMLPNARAYRCAWRCTKTPTSAPAMMRWPSSRMATTPQWG